MNSFMHLLLFTVVAAVLFASSDPTATAAPAGEQVTTEPPKGNDVKGKDDGGKGKGDDGKNKDDDGKNKGSFLDLFPGKNDKKKGTIGDVANNFGTGLKGAWSGLQSWFSDLKI